MDWLTDNAIANMFGPHFLLLYGIVILLTLGTCWIFLGSRINSLSASSTSFEIEPVYVEVVSACRRIRFMGAFVLAGLGGYKLFVALSKGFYNVLFLVVMGTILLCILFSMRQIPDQKPEG